MISKQQFRIFTVKYFSNLMTTKQPATTGNFSLKFSQRYFLEAFITNKKSFFEENVQNLFSKEKNTFSCAKKRIFAEKESFLRKTNFLYKNHNTRTETSVVCRIAYERTSSEGDPFLSEISLFLTTYQYTYTGIYSSNYKNT